MSIITTRPALHDDSDSYPAFDYTQLPKLVNTGTTVEIHTYNSGTSQYELDRVLQPEEFSELETLSDQFPNHNPLTESFFLMDDMIRSVHSFAPWRGFIDFIDKNDADLLAAGYTEGYVGGDLPLPWPRPEPLASNDAFLKRSMIRSGYSFFAYRHRPTNPRIMEAAIFFAFFYTYNRPWNVYYHNPLLAEVIKYSTRRWLAMQFTTGVIRKFRSPTFPSGASTSFGCQSFVAAYRMLKQDGTFDSDFISYVFSRLRIAMIAHLSSDSRAIEYRWSSNQYQSLYSAASSYLAEFPTDSEFEAIYTSRLTDPAPDGGDPREFFQSQAGYMYEDGGMDHGYNIQTYMSRWNIAYSAAPTAAIKAAHLEELTRFLDWLKYNIVPDDDETFYFMAGPSNRQDLYKMTYIYNFAVETPTDIIKAISKSQEAHTASLTGDNATFVAGWPNTNTFGGNLGNVQEDSYYGPNVISYYRPTAAEKTAAILSELPCHSPTNLIHQRKDHNTNSPIDSLRGSGDKVHEFTFVKKPDYYFAFASGHRFNALYGSTRQQMGLELLWNVDTGPIIQNRYSSYPWATYVGSTPDTTKDILASYYIDDSATPYTPVNGNTDIAGTKIRFDYTTSIATKSVTADTSSIVVDVTASGSFYEQLPLVLDSSSAVNVVGDTITVTRNVGTMQIVCVGLDSATVLSASSGCVRLRLNATNTLQYTITFP